MGQLLRGKWHLDELLAVGGMASVFAATHRNGMRGAVKLLHYELSLDEPSRDRFLREGYVANKVAHDGAVRVLDDDICDDGTVFLVMELLDGLTVDALLRSRKNRSFTLGETLRVADRLLDVLAASHDKGIVHRDIKPENLFLTTDGRLKVLDFGIARLREAHASPNTTRAGDLLGTPSFMPPEQALGNADQVDARSDLWSVGATMFRLLTGRTVHHAESINRVLLSAMTMPAPPVASVLPTIPPALAAIVDRALAFAQHDRWPDARSMRAALHAFADASGLRLDGPVQGSPDEQRARPTTLALDTSAAVPLLEDVDAPTVAAITGSHSGVVPQPVPRPPHPARPNAPFPAAPFPATSAPLAPSLPAPSRASGSPVGAASPYAPPPPLLAPGASSSPGAAGPAPSFGGAAPPPSPSFGAAPPTSPQAYTSSASGVHTPPGASFGAGTAGAPTSPQAYTSSAPGVHTPPGASFGPAAAPAPGPSFGAAAGPPSAQAYTSPPAGVHTPPAGFSPARAAPAGPATALLPATPSQGLPSHSTASPVSRDHTLGGGGGGVPRSNPTGLFVVLGAAAVLGALAAVFVLRSPASSPAAAPLSATAATSPATPASTDPATPASAPPSAAPTDPAAPDPAAPPSASPTAAPSATATTSAASAVSPPTTSATPATPAAAPRRPPAAKTADPFSSRKW